MAVSASRKARVELVCESKSLDPGLKDAARKLRAFEREQVKAAKQVAREQMRADKEAARERAALRNKFDHTARNALMGTAGGLGLGSVASGLGGMMKETFDVEKELTHFRIDAQLSGDQINAFRDQIMKASEATGRSRQELVEAAHGYQILTGDAKGAVDSVQLFAEVANASGSSMESIQKSAAAMRMSLKMDPTEMRQGFDELLNLGHNGAIELRDMGDEMPKILSLFKGFGTGSGSKHLLEAAAAAEVIKVNFSDASTTATGMTQLLVSLTKRAKQLKAAGVEVFHFDAKTGINQARGFWDIMTDLRKKFGNDPEALMHVLGGRSEASRAALAAMEGLDRAQELMSNAEGSDQVAKDNMIWMNSTAGKLSVAFEHVKNSVAAAFTPDRIDAFVSALVAAGDAAAAVIGAISGTGKTIGESVAKGGSWVDWFGAGVGLNNTVYKGFGGGVAKEDQMDEADAARRETRLAHFHGKSPAAAAAAVAAEDATDARLRRMIGGGGSAFIGPLAPGEKRGNGGDIPLGELLGIRRMAAGGSDPKTAQLADMAIQKEMLDQLKAIVSAIQKAGEPGRGPMSGQVANSIYHAAANAHALRSGPGHR